MALVKKNRLTGPKNYRDVQEKGKVHQFNSFGVAIYEKKDGLPSRFGFIVSTKISKDAVDRNRFRRTMSEAVRTSSIDLKDGFDVVFLAKPLMVRIPTSEVMREVKLALRQTGLLK